jgi:hypothetical protein
MISYIIIQCIVASYLVRTRLSLSQRTTNRIEVPRGLRWPFAVSVDLTYNRHYTNQETIVINVAVSILRP